MAKIITDVLLKDGTDETTFINDVTSNENVDLLDRVSSLNNMVVLSVEENYLDTLKSHSSVVSAEFFEDSPAPVTYPSTPSTYTLSNKSIGGTTYWTNYSGQDMLSYQHYLDTDHMPDPTPDRTINGFTGHNVGWHYFYGTAQGERDQVRHFGPEPASDGSTYGDASTYYTTYTGKHVDIVTLEGGSDGASNPNYVGYHSNHPDWVDPDNTSNSRMVPMNWPGISHSTMNQVSSNLMLNDHAVGVLSAAGGINGGFAKRSSLRAGYLTGTGITAALNSIKSWHQSKSNNSETGYPNPTVLLTEWHHPTKSKNTYVKVDDIASVTDPTYGTANRPGSGWGSDLTPFVLRHLIPFQVNDPIDGSWNWCIPFASSQATYFSAIEQCWNAGIHVVTSVGNGGAVYCRTTDPEYNGTYITMNSGNYYKYTMIFPASGEQSDPMSMIRGLDNTTTHYPLRPFGPGGLAKSINVAAGQNSEGCNVLDNYTSRGPGIDLIGRGSLTFTAGDVSNPTFSDGYKWGTFGGTSCAIPTVGGKLACYIEKHYTINGVYPTPDQAKAAMVAEAKATSISVRSTNWPSVPTASGTTIDPGQQAGVNPGANLKVQSGVTVANAGTCFLDHAGTPCKQAYWNAQNFNREQTYKKRPTSGVLFPRPRKFDIPPVEEAAT